MKTTQTTYPEALLKNIASAELGAVNHYTVADQVLKIAASDVNRAAREGSHMITGTRLGNIEVKKTETRGIYSANNFNTGAGLFRGSKAEAVAFVACAYVIA